MMMMIRTGSCSSFSSSMTSFFRLLGFAWLLVGNLSNLLFVSAAFDRSFIPSNLPLHGGIHRTAHQNHYDTTRVFAENPRKEDRFRLMQAETTNSFNDNYSFDDEETTNNKSKNVAESTSRSDPSQAFLMLALAITVSMGLMSLPFELHLEATSGIFENGLDFVSSWFRNAAISFDTVDFGTGLDQVQHDLFRQASALQMAWMTTVERLNQLHQSLPDQSREIYNAMEMQTMTLQQSTLSQVDNVKDAMASIDIPQDPSAVVQGSILETKQALQDTTMTMQSSTIQVANDMKQSIADIQATTISDTTSATQTFIIDVKNGVNDAVLSLQSSTIQLATDMKQSVIDMQAVVPEKINDMNHVMTNIQMFTTQAASDFQQSMIDLQTTLPEKVATTVNTAVSDLQASTAQAARDINAGISDLQVSTAEIGGRLQQSMINFQESVPQKANEVKTVIMDFQTTLPQKVSNVQLKMENSMTSMATTATLVVDDMKVTAIESAKAANAAAEAFGTRIVSLPQTIVDDMKQAVMDIQASPQVSALKQLVKNSIPPSISEMKQALMDFLFYISQKVNEIKDATVTSWNYNTKELQVDITDIQASMSNQINDMQSNVVEDITTSYSQINDMQSNVVEDITTSYSQQVNDMKETIVDIPSTLSSQQVSSNVEPSSSVRDAMAELEQKIKGY